MITASLSADSIFQLAYVTSANSKSFMFVRVLVRSWTPSFSTSMYSGASVLPNPSQSFFLTESQAAFSFAMMSDSETAPVDFVSAPLFALAVLAFAVTSLFPEGAVAQAAARIDRDTRTRIFFMIGLLRCRGRLCRGFYVKTRPQSRVARVASEFAGLVNAAERGRPRP